LILTNHDSFTFSVNAYMSASYESSIVNSPFIVTSKVAALTVDI